MMGSYRWVKVTEEAAFAPHDGAGALVHNGNMWLLGGWNPRGKTHFPLLFNNEVWGLEGRNPNNRNDVWYSDDGMNWHELPDVPWPPRHAASVFVHDEALWMVAGNNMTSDV